MNLKITFQVIQKQSNSWNITYQWKPSKSKEKALLLNRLLNQLNNTNKKQQEIIFYDDYKEYKLFIKPTIKYVYQIQEINN